MFFKSQIGLFVCILIRLGNGNQSENNDSMISELVVRHPSGDISIDVGPFFKLNSSRDGDKTQQTIDIPFLGFLGLGARNGTEDTFNLTNTLHNATIATQQLIRNESSDVMNSTISISSVPKTPEDIIVNGSVVMNSTISASSVPEVRHPSSDVSINVGPFFKLNSSRDGDKSHHSIDIPFLGILGLGARKSSDVLSNMTAADSEELYNLTLGGSDRLSNQTVFAIHMNSGDGKEDNSTLTGMEAAQPFNASSLCPPANGETISLFVHPTVPQWFYACDHGVSYLFQCPEPLIFNSKLNVCDWNYKEL